MPPFAKQLKRRKELYEALHPETKAHVAGGKTGGRGRPKIAGDKMSSAMGEAWAADRERKSFAADTAAKTGKSRRTVERDIAPPFSR